MTRLEQQTFVKALLQSFQSSFDADFMAGRIPEHWTGQQLRLYFEDKAAYDHRPWITPGEREKFAHDCRINNL